MTKVYDLVRVVTISYEQLTDISRVYYGMLTSIHGSFYVLIVIYILYMR